MAHATWHACAPEFPDRWMHGSTMWCGRCSDARDACDLTFLPRFLCRFETEADIKAKAAKKPAPAKPGQPPPEEPPPLLPVGPPFVPLSGPFPV